MLTKLVIRNFQRHRKLTIDLDPCITTIVGPTDAGKSAVLRALRWLCLNKPRGEAFRRIGSRKTSVTLYVDGHKIRRTRTKHTNQYWLDGRRMVAFRNEVPAEIRDILRLEEAHFQSQHDGAFWFHESASEVSRRLNQVVDLGLIDSTLGKLDSSIRATRAAISVGKERLQTAQEGVQSLSHAKDVDRSLRKVERAQVTHAETSEKTRLARSLVSSAISYQENVTNLLCRLQEGRNVATVGERWRKVCSRMELLSNLVRQAARLSRISRITVPSLERVERMELRLREQQERRIALQGVVRNVQRLTAALRTLREEQQSAERKFHKLMGRRCALCGQSVPGSSRSCAPTCTSH
jgi:exonuclease SbcC